MAQENISPTPAIELNRRNSLVLAFAVGTFVGFLGWIVALGVQDWVLAPIFCRSVDSTSVCGNSQLISWVVAYIFASMAGLMMMIRSGVFRPLLIVLAVLATMWAIGTWFTPDLWGAGILWSTVLFAISYALYTWLASIKSFAIAVTSTIITVVLVRLFMIL